MRVKKKLISSPVSIIGLICVLVLIIFGNTYLSNYRQKLSLRQLSLSIALLETFQSKSETNINGIVSTKLRQLKILEERTKKIDQFGQLASAAILIGSLILVFIFIHNVNKFVHKFDLLSVEIHRASHQNDLEQCRLDYPITNGPSSEVDSMAMDLEHIFRNFRQSSREKNGILNICKQTIRDLNLKVDEGKDTHSILG